MNTRAVILSLAALLLAGCDDPTVNSPMVRLCRDTMPIAVRTPPGFAGTITVKVAEDQSRCRTVK